MACPVDGKVIVGRLDLAGTSLSIGADLMAAYVKVYRRHGYTELTLLTDGTNRLAALPPDRQR